MRILSFIFRKGEPEVELQKHAQRGINWLLRGHYFLEPIRKDLENFQAHLSLLNKKSALNEMKSAIRNARQSARADSREHAEVAALENDLKRITEDIHYSGSFKEIAALHEHLKIEAAHIVKTTSRFHGSLLQGLSRLSQLVENKQSPEVKAEIEQLVRTLKLQVAVTLKWMDTLILDLKKAQRIRKNSLLDTKHQELTPAALALRAKIIALLPQLSDSQSIQQLQAQVQASIAVMRDEFSDSDLTIISTACADADEVYNWRLWDKTQFSRFLKIIVIALQKIAVSHNSRSTGGFSGRQSVDVNIHNMIRLFWKSLGNRASLNLEPK